MSDLEAIIFGPPDSPFEKGIFKVDIKLPERYPFEPPQGNFGQYLIVFFQAITHLSFAMTKARIKLRSQYPEANKLIPLHDILAHILH